MTSNPEISKSSRHSKITGDFAERLVLYWLSKYGFECAYVDHVGLDLIARNPHTRELMGISVKSRSRIAQRERAHVLFPTDNLDKLDGACTAFGCKPYFAIVVDAGQTITTFILSKAHLLELSPPGKAGTSWSMSEASLERYASDSDVRMFRFTTETVNWWGKPTEKLMTSGAA